MTVVATIGRRAELLQQSIPDDRRQALREFVDDDEARRRGQRPRECRHLLLATG
jgi:hypothetical protein